ncbi:hypothetical protein N7495_005935 [Penicillium taxi]|uniref:uncharacterized protein n=1 Tax=Penicillium taxi TaxID=168475 RepID=UPI002545474B|nr:uncharacterized protein N7495_005935 [Penicillium taxi]KAJ5894244.1 hypothetical protein N7495_005935 [Penicillium taxi]
MEPDNGSDSGGSQGPDSVSRKHVGYKSLPGFCDSDAATYLDLVDINTLDLVGANHDSVQEECGSNKVEEHSNDKGSEESSEEDPDHVKTRPKIKNPRKPILSAPKRKVKLTAQERKRSMEVGLKALIKNARMKGKKSFEKATLGKRKTLTSGLAPLELEKIFESGGIISSAQENEASAAIPGFKSGNRVKALDELIANIPNLTPEDKKKATTDKKNILRAIDNFSHKPKSDNKGGWKMKGLKTGLMNHQILAVGWMRSREKGGKAPLGGLLCDVMGFGKTVTTLAVVLDGRAQNFDGQNPTLIVVPPSLRSHWVAQIDRFFESEVFGTFLEYRNLSKSTTNNNVTSMLRTDVVIATYDEVRMSYPSLKVPQHILANQIRSCWNEEFENRGSLHRVPWHRIILDGRDSLILQHIIEDSCILTLDPLEGHTIRNPDSNTSIAVRGLIGQHKWVVSGTPLHNCIEELFPYFHFIDVPAITDFSKYEENFSKMNEKTREKLIDTLRTVVHRMTHNSRLFTLPIIKLPMIAEKVEKLDLCNVETQLYHMIEQAFVEKINAFADENERQWSCVLTMFLKLRMFTSHLLTVHEALQGLLKRPGNKESLKWDTGDEISPEIHKVLMRLLRGSPTRTTRGLLDPLVVKLPSGDFMKLQLAFQRMLADLPGDVQMREYAARMVCPRCEETPDVPILTSCKHLYCIDCYNGLPDENGNSDSEFPVCCICKVVIEEAVRCELKDLLLQSESACRLPKTGDKRKRSPSNAQKQKANRKRHFGITEWSERSSGSKSTPVNESTKNEIPDWISIVGTEMPSTKLSKIRSMVKDWLKEDPAMKTVIFTQFLGTMRLLAGMCAKEQWQYNQLCGSMSMEARDSSILKFQTDEEVKVMVVTMKTGGTGLDLSVANKCILVDLWWNEAAQEQAFCRLYRLGQMREVVFVKLVTNDTIDDLMLEIQTNKSTEISNVITYPGLGDSKASWKQILSHFGEVQDRVGGGFIILPTKRKKRSMTT